MTTAHSYDSLLLAQACRLGTSTLYEASGLPTSAVDPAIRTVWTGASVAGPAYPLECSPGDNLSIHIAMEKVPRGSVLVIPAAHVGETLAQGQTRADKEAKMMDALREGRSTLELMGLTSWRGTP